MPKLLIAVDGSDHAAHAINFVLKLVAGGMSNVEAVLVNIQADPEIRALAMHRETILGLQREHAEEVLHPARERLEQAGVRVFTRMEHGEAAVQIVRVAEESGCDHIVMGTRGLGGLAGLVLGSTATKVLHLTGLPVTLIK